MNERDFEKKRESKSGEQYKRNNPPPLDFKNPYDAERAVRDMNNALRLGYSKDYEKLIKMYFEKLQENGSANPQ